MLLIGEGKDTKKNYTVDEIRFLCSLGSFAHHMQIWFRRERPIFFFYKNNHVHLFKVVKNKQI